MGRFEYLEGEVPDIPCAAAVKTSTHVYVSGTAVFQDEQGNVFSDVKDQTCKCLNKIEQILSKWDLTRKDIVMVTVLVRGKENFMGMNEAYKGFFGDAFPSRTACVSDLGHPDMLVEISRVACL